MGAGGADSIQKGTTMSSVPGYTAGCDEGTFLVGPVGPASCCVCGLTKDIWI